MLMGLKIMQKKLTALIFICSISGCATLDNSIHSTDPTTGERQVNNTAKGAGIGALAGAVIGAIADGGKGAAIGAASGAALGGGIGYYMDRQEAELRRKLEGTGVRVLREGNNLKLIMPGNITFATGSANINATFYPVLNSVALVLKEYNKSRLGVYGFTDATGRFERNQILSEQRADSVAAYLTGQGIAPARMTVKGMSQRFPIASNDTPQGREQNRRVELLIETPQAIGAL